MQLDALTNFIQPNGTPVSLVGAAGATIPIGQIIDLLGYGVGVAPSQSNIGNTTLWGVDPGIGRVRPEIEILIGTAVTTADACTTAFALQYAADTGAAGGYLPGTWYTASQTNAHVAAQLTAAQILRMDLAPAPPEVPAPRFVQLVAITPAGLVNTAGTVAFAGLTMVRDDLTNKNAANNYTVA